MHTHTHIYIIYIIYLPIYLSIYLSIYLYFLVNLHIYVTHHFILLGLNSSALWWLGGMIAWALFVIVVGLLVSRGCVKNVSWSWLSLLQGWGGLWHFMENLYRYGSPFYFATAQSQCLMAIGKVVWALYVIFVRFACQQRVLKNNSWS